MKLPEFILAFCFLWLWNLPSFSQKTVMETGKYMMRIESSMSEDEATKQAIKLAQINAIENAFGKVIVQGNSTLIQNTSSGQQTETNSTFNFMADSYVNGEWLETLDEQKEIVNGEDGSRWIKVTVKGRIRELKNVTYSCETYALSCPQLSCKATEFNNGQSLYIYFRSPKDGYISIYFDDPYEKITSRILPYSHSANGVSVNFPVKADTAYILFSPKHDYLNDVSHIDELELSANNLVDQYKIYVFYSPEKFDKPILDTNTKELYTSHKIDAGCSMPPGLSSEKFQNWQLIVRGKNPNIEMQTIMITVRK